MTDVKALEETVKKIMAAHPDNINLYTVQIGKGDIFYFSFN